MLADETGLLAAAGGGLKGLCTLIGAIAGALTMQSFSRGLELTSAGLLTFVTTPGHPALHIRLTPKQREENELV